MKKIVLDTNMLMSIGVLNVDIFSEVERICNFKHEITTLSSVVEELKKLQDKKPVSDAKAAKLALQILEHKKIKIIKSDLPYADDGIVAVADHDTIVATQDIGLIKRLKEKKIPTIAIRQKKYLILR